ncbi:MAG: hypothetical protein QOJ66_60 [Ilumatobacteraceae bacterium]
MSQRVMIDYPWCYGRRRGSSAAHLLRDRRRRATLRPRRRAAAHDHSSPLAANTRARSRAGCAAVRAIDQASAPHPRRLSVAARSTFCTARCRSIHRSRRYVATGRRFDEPAVDARILPWQRGRVLSGGSHISRRASTDRGSPIGVDLAANLQRPPRRATDGRRGSSPGALPRQLGVAIPGARAIRSHRDPP